jgi:hypothetical protein
MHDGVVEHRVLDGQRWRGLGADGGCREHSEREAKPSNEPQQTVSDESVGRYRGYFSSFGARRLAVVLASGLRAADPRRCAIPLLIGVDPRRLGL